MTEEQEPERSVSIRTSPDADDNTKDLANRLLSIFNGPSFADAVRQAVEDMILEGKLAYDYDHDTFDVPLDIVKNWALEREKENWSGKR
ncbi:MAG: hypothetical protein ACMUIG_05195 [Thermoplasmatota archaeon]